MIKRSIHGPYFPNVDWSDQRPKSPIKLRPQLKMEGRCRMGACMGAASSNELAAVVANLTPNQAAEAMIGSYCAGRRAGVMMGVMVGVAGCWLVRRLVK